jgi:succinate dehydrogenase/fumarate reductase flavoprotein subunit
MDARTIETDVLVIGGGGAALMGALEARKKGAEVLILCKKETARSGCTPYAVTNITRSTPESEEELFRQMVEVGGWLNDQEILDVFVREVATVIPSLAEYGVPMTIADGSHYHLENYPHGPQPNLPGIFNVTPGPGRPLSFNLTLPLREAAERLGVRIMDGTTVTSLLVADGCAAGAVALSLSTGELLHVSAKAVIVATGGSARIYERSDNPVDLTGDGFYIAWQAGADLINMEMTAFNPLKITEEVRAMIKSGKPDPKLLAVGRAHYNLGGIMTDIRAESTLRNLYAAGEVADGLLGAARLGGTALADALVFGAIAGREAGARVRGESRREGLTPQVEEERERIRLLAGGGEMTPLELQKAVKSVMWDCAGMAKTEHSLNVAVRRLAELSTLPMRVESADPKAVGQAIEGRLMAGVGELIAVASLQRKETRGQFWRLDHPEPDNANCLFNMIMSRRDGSIAIRTKRPPMTRLPSPSAHPLVGCGCFNYLPPKKEG